MNRRGADNDKRMRPHTRYVFDGKELPSVTTIAGHTPKPELNRWYWNQGRMGIPFDASLKRAQDVGSIVHEVLESRLTGKECDLSIYPQKEIQKGVEIAGRIYNVVSNLGSPIRLEVPVVCRKYGGTPDGIFRKDGKVILVDYKTSNAIHSDHFVQLAGYVLILSHKHRILAGRETGEWVDSQPLLIDQAMIIHAPKTLSGVMCVEVSTETLRQAMGVFKARYLAFILDRKFRRLCDGK